MAQTVLMPPEVGVGRGVFHLGNRLHRLGPFGFLGVVNDQVEGLPLAGTEDTQQVLGFLTQGRRWIPPLDQEAIVDAGPVGRGVHIPVEVRDIPPTPHHRYRQHQQPEVGEMVPVKMPLQGPKKLVQGGGHAYDAKHEVILLSPLANGR